MSAEDPRQPLDTRTTRLALAVRLFDGFTSEPLSVDQLFTSPKGTRIATQQPTAKERQRQRERRRRQWPSERLTVSLASLDATPVLLDATPVINPSGYVLFFQKDIPDELDSVEITVAGGGQYADTDRTVVFATLDTQRYPVEEITLEPLPTYRFPRGTTLIRGSVFVVDDAQTAGDPEPTVAEDASVTLSIDGFDRTTTVVGSDEFVLPITGLTADNVEGNEFIRVNGAFPLLTVDLGEPENVSVPLRIREGETGCHQFKYDADGNVAHRECGAEWTLL